MPALAPKIESDRLPSASLRRYAWGVLAYFIAVILWGSLVRATGSGAGCGDHWPLCNGTVVQHSARIDTIIEFTHRITSGISLFSVVGLMIWTLIATTRGHLARAAAIAAVVFTLLEAVLGALLVKLGYTAQSQSPMRPAFLALHLANTLLLLAALTLTAHFLGRRIAYSARNTRLTAPLGAIVAILIVMTVGVTGSLAALGDTLFPASNLAQALAQDFSRTAGWLVRWRWLHPTAAILAGVFVLWLTRRAAKDNAYWDNRQLSKIVLALLAVVYSLGVLDIVLLAPVWVQIVHLLAADSLWASLVVLTARLTLRPRDVI